MKDWYERKMDKEKINSVKESYKLGQISKSERDKRIKSIKKEGYF